MAQVRHAFESAKGDGGDSTLVQPSNWNEDHEGIVSVRKTADESVTSSTTLQDDDHLKFALAANEVWVFEAFLVIEGATSGDFKFTFTVPASGAALFNALVLLEAASDNQDLALATPTVAASVIVCGALGAGTKIGLHVRGTVVNAGNAGDLQLQWAQQGSSGTATKVLTNSWLTGHRVA